MLFMILTAARLSEATRVTWREIDLSERIWRVPAERMKARKVHTVPLSEQALEILNHMNRPASREDSLVFPVVDRNGCIRNPGQEMISYALRKLGRKDADGRRIVAHGFRASFRVWGIEQARAPRDVCEAVLAHQESDRTVAAYTAGADLFDDRKELMQSWRISCCLALGLSRNSHVCCWDHFGSALPFPLLTVLMECPNVWLRRRAASLARML